MKNLTYTTLLMGVFFTTQSFSQQSKIDSLTFEFNRAKKDTTKIRILSEIGVAYYYTDREQAIKINDSLIRFATGKSDRYVAQGYRMKGTFSLLSGDYDYSSEYYNTALNIAQEIKDKELQVNLLGNLGTLYGRKGEGEIAIKYYLDAIALNDNHEPKWNIRPYINLAITVGNQNRLEDAVSYLIKALDIAESHGSSQLTYIHNQLAVNYLKLDRYEKAESHLIIALPLAEKLEDTYALAGIHNSLGYLHETRDDNWDKALHHYQKTLHYHTILNNKSDIISNLYNVGQQFKRLNQFSKAEEHYTKGLQLSDSMQHISNKIEGNYYLATLFVEQGKIKTAKDHINVTRSLIANNSRITYRNHYHRLAKSFEEKRLYKEAYNNMESFAVLSDSLFKINGVDKLAEIEAKYQTQKNENENLKLLQENEEQSRKLETQNRQKWYFILGLSFSLIVLGIISLFYRKTKKQKDVIEELQKELHHRIKNNLSIIDTFIEVAKDEFKDKRFEEKLTELQNRIQSINEIHKQLYTNTDVNHLNMRKYIHSLATQIASSLNSEIPIKQSIDESLHLNANQSFPVGLIINEFITNSIKYAFPKKTGSITIKMSKTNESYNLLIADNGKGLPNDFDIGTVTSFGMRIMKLLTEQLQGSFELQSNNGVQLNITFPNNSV